MSKVEPIRAGIAAGRTHIELEEGREACARRAWGDAYRLLSLAEESAALSGEDLELLATAAYLTGREDDHIAALDRAHRAFMRSGAVARAVRCAFWLGMCLLLRREAGPAAGWFARGERLLEREARECAERGYLLVPVVWHHYDAADWSAAHAAAVLAVEISARFDDADLAAIARQLQGRVLLQQGRIAPGLALLDEVMVAVTTGELSPIATGWIYCSVIEACHEIYALRRAQEWTAALVRWCQEQSDLVAFTGVCLLHRVQLLELKGCWQEAIEEAQRARERSLRAGNRRAATESWYQQGEVHRLRGEFAAAEAAYRSASERGYEPQPGLALLRLMQGRTDAAAAAIRRVVSAKTERLPRVRLLMAHVEIMLAAGDLEAARAASAEIAETAACFATETLDAMAAHARGAVELASGEAQAALAWLRRACQTWQQLEAPYALARARVLAGLACRAVGDDEGGRLELHAARVVFDQLGAACDVAQVDALMQTALGRDVHGLTPRELQVIRLLATGKTNKAIAAVLFVSEKTVNRHVSNLFAKLEVPTRAAATAYAYEHKLL